MRKTRSNLTLDNKKKITSHNTTTIVTIQKNSKCSLCGDREKT